MENRYFKNKILSILAIIIVIIMAFIAVPTLAQTSFKTSKENYSVKAMGSLFNLKYGGIIEDSEKIYLNNKLLSKKNSEYSINYSAATLIINSQLKIGDRVDIDYLYTPNTAKTSGVATTSALPKFQFTSGNSLVDMSLLYNAVDATTGASTYGTNLKTTLSNNFNVDSHLYKSIVDKNATGNDNGSGDFNLHDINFKAGKLEVEGEYQNISSGFNGFNYIRSSGSMDTNLVNALEKEKGLERNNFGLKYAIDPNSSFKFNYNTINDTSDSIQNTGFAFSNTKLSFTHSTQSIGSNFTRFSDIREADRTTLAGEKGIDRTNTTLAYDFGTKGGKMSFAQNSINDSNDSINNTSLSYKNSKLTANYSTQSIGNNFSSFTGLREADKAALAAEKGMDRKNLSLGYDFGTKGGKMAFAQNSIYLNNNSIQSTSLDYNNSKLKASYYNRDVESAFGSFGNLRDGDKAQIAAESGINRTGLALAFDSGKKDASKWQSYSSTNLTTEAGDTLATNRLSANFNNFEAEYFSLQMDNNYNRMNALNADERNQFSGLVRKVFDYNSGVAQANDYDRNSWYYQAGINRTMSYTKYKMNKDSYLTYTAQNLDTKNGASADTTRLNYAGKDIKAWYYKDDIDKDFNKLASLTNIERDQLNNQYGMSNLNYGFEGITKIGYLKYTDNSINDEINNAGFKRTLLTYGLPKYNFTRISTKFDNNFSRIGDISDPSRANYVNDRGYDKDEYITNLKFGGSKNTFDVNSYIADANKVATGENYARQILGVNYKPNDKFAVSYNSDNYQYENGDNLLKNNKDNIIKISNNFNVNKMKNNYLSTQYHTYSFLDGNSKPVEQRFIDLNYKSDQSAKFILNLDYNSSEYSKIDKSTKYDLYANQKITDKFGIILGYGQTEFTLKDPESRIKYGVSYSVNNTFALSYSIDKTLNGDNTTKDNQYFSINGKLPKILSANILDNVVLNYKYDLNETINSREKYDDGYSVSASVLKGNFIAEKSSVLDSTTKAWYRDNTKLSYSNAKLFDTQLSVDYSKETTTNNTTRITGDTEKCKLAYALNNIFSIGYNKSTGNWGDNKFIPVQSEEFNLTKKFSADSNLSLKYSMNKNSTLKKDETIWGLAFNTTNDKQKKGKFNVSAGLSSSHNINTNDTDTSLTYSLAYEYMISKEQFLSIIASKSTDVQNASNVNDYVSDTIGLDYRTSF